ncbi:hypothetical protein [Leptospira stimsonii]|uniref:Uncharacterized protein n=1 Tax=Leptospira stimsonii TaxID=2202203 RepID=A0ABY2NBL0_9LEPT|nr:hypothetical protein [Leptospira stimsonii]TGK19448.1 hypothetical protein EHO98_11655 [Leptospira stimsonii]TGM20451.1 hypothetical protein EHQ90_02680 [Leptospira stimsonii]
MPTANYKKLKSQKDNQISLEYYKIPFSKYPNRIYRFTKELGPGLKQKIIPGEGVAEAAFCG